MLSPEIRQRIVALIKREVVPAIGCTEPVAVALCVARAKEELGSIPEKITVGLSGNMLKNAMGVGIPGTGMIGLPIAIALGALIGKSEYQLEVLRDVCPEAVDRGKLYVARKCIAIRHIPDAPSKLHIDVTAEGNGHTVRTVISGSHTNFILIEKDGETVLSKQASAAGDSENTAADPELTLRTVWEFATESPLDELRFILEARDLNKKAAAYSFTGDFGHALGSTLRHKGEWLFGNTPLAHAIAYTSAACDARMGGAPIAVMSNSGSGNQGITATMPVVSFAEDIDADEEHTVRALALSHLTSIYIKQSLGRLSALCGCVVASTGSSAGITYLMGGDYECVCNAIKNMVANLAGMVCDGAKPSCSLKVSSGVSTAMMSAMLAVNDRYVTSAEGIVCDSVDDTVHNLTSIGRDAMNETDRLILKMMTEK